MLEVGIIGTGVQGTRRAEAAVRTRGVKLVGVYDTDTERADALAERLGCKAVRQRVADADLVVVATSNLTHANITRDALARGQHVLCEKPLALSGREAVELADTAAKAGLVLRSGYHIRHYPGVQRLRELITSGQLGELPGALIAYGSHRAAGFTDSWRCDPAISGGGVLVDQGIHALDLAHWLLGANGVAHCSVRNSRTLTDRVEDNAHVLLDCALGLVSVNVSWTRWPARFWVKPLGTEVQCSLTGLEARYGRQQLSVGERLMTFAQVNVWDREWRDILSELRGEPHVGDDGHTAVALLDAARRYTA